VVIKIKWRRVMNDIPIIEEKTKDELDEIIQIIKASSLPELIKSFIINCINSAAWFPHILQKKNISLKRLRKMLFGKSYKSRRQQKSNEADDKNKIGDALKSQENTDANIPTESSLPNALTTTATIEMAVNKTSSELLPPENVKEKKPGHGRMSHTVYEEYREIILTIIGFKVGDPCPQECGGVLYVYEPEKPRVLLRIKGRNFADVYKYIVERLRCNLCDYLIQANIPAEVGADKYDASFKAWIIVQKYFVAVPFYRQETFQRMLNFPLSDATQWDLVEKAAGFCYRVFNLLIAYAANSKLINNDDTGVKIQEVIQEIKNNPDAKRTGMFTTGIIAEHENYKIALFFNGTSHSGENMDAVLRKRDLDKPPIIQMCDALNSNLAKEVETMVCNCLSHGFRKFDELVDYFPTPCITIMKLLSQVYDNDAITKTMTDKERLLHHQKHSASVMETLKKYLQALFDEKLVEPNSELGKAIKYMQRHWHKLTRFLSVAGAPLCNNIVERALKIAIRNRKNAMFYRTRYSASIGGMLTSLIYTCHLNKKNPHHYLTMLQEHYEEINKNPERWLPWNYQETLKPPGSAIVANPQEYQHARDSPVAI
jgi:transposase